VRTSVKARAPLTEPIGSVHPDQADAAPIDLIDPSCIRPHVTQLFFSVAQSFYYIVSHFAVMNSEKPSGQFLGLIVMSH
jgi:hypothetical protein